MATIKLQPSGKVVIKDGKVACGCCEQPTGCCMYPAQGLADAIYTADDLPDDVTVNGTSFPRSGTTYGNTTNGVIFEENVWAKYTSGVRSSRPCLIQGGVEDQFADSYQITAQGESVIVTRTNDICIWTGENQYGPAGIAYSGASPYIWFAFISLPEPFFGTDGEKQGFQSSPVGTYYGGITVS